VVGRALTVGPGSVSDRGRERADRAGPAPGGLGADRRARASGRAGAKGYPGVRAVRSRSDGGGLRGVRGGPRGSEPFNQDRTGEIRPGRMSDCGWR
jgi:hypothetical protein